MKGLHHVGITVRDLDASIRFYHDVLGLQFSNEPSPWFEGEELGPAVGVPGAALRQVSLLLGDTTLELLEYKSPPSETDAPLKSNNRGASHVAFLVDDIEVLRLHYAETLKAWRERFLAHRDDVERIYDPRFVRMWEFYLASSEMAFRQQAMMVFQIQLTKRQGVVPITRDYIAQEEARLRAIEGGQRPPLRLAGE